MSRARYALGSDRIHLIVDCYENEQLREMIAKEVPAEATRRKLSHLTGDAAEERLQHAGRLLSLPFGHWSCLGQSEPAMTLRRFSSR